MAKKREHKEKALVRMLVYVLGVAPAEFGLVPRGQGWVEVKELLKALHEDPGWRHVRQGMVADAARRLAPGELELEGKKIRCLSRRPPEPRPGQAPPAHLYLGLRRRAWPSARKRGLTAGPKGPLLLAVHKEAALGLGRRRDPQPVLITVQARQAQDKGVEFSAWGESLYLCDWLPADCLMGPALPERPAPRERKKEPSPPAPEAAESMAGSFAVTPEDLEKPYRQKGLRKKIKWKDQRRRGRRRGRREG